MSARDDYPFPAAVADGRVDGGAYGAAESADALDEIDHLRRWKAEAMVVLERWDQCYERLIAEGTKADIGGWKSRIVLDWITDHQSGG